MVDTPRNVTSLTERERQVLRMLILGHDAKSIARGLAISVHTVNERLRSARHKLDVSSSRAAARLLAQHEGGGPNSTAYESIGVAPARDREADGPAPDPRAPESRPLLRGAWIGPLVIAIAMLGAAAMIVHSNSGPAASPPAAPRVVTTHPEPDSTVAPGPLTLTVTFDRPMRPGDYSFVQIDPATYPQCGDNRPTQSSDGRTFTLQCTLRPGARYEIWFNSGPYTNFKSVEGVPAVPFQLRFGTKRN